MVGERSTYAVARAASELDSDLPYVSSSAAWSKLIHNYDWPGAERTFRRALEIEPDNASVLHWLSHTLSWRGQTEEALRVARFAVEVEPDSQLMAMNLAYILVDARQYDEALMVAKGVLAVDPGYMGARRNLFLHELRSGQYADGANSFVRYTTMIGGEPAAAREVAQLLVAYAESGTVSHLSDDLISRRSVGQRGPGPGDGPDG